MPRFGEFGSLNNPRDSFITVNLIFDQLANFVKKCKLILRIAWVKLMELDQIKTYIESPDTQERMKAIAELRNYQPHIVVPLLKQRMYDKEFIIRSFVAMGLGRKQTEEGFQALLDIIEQDSDYNVIAEAANSLARYGERSLTYLLKLFKQKPHWLIRQSIFAAMEDINVPEAILQMCVWGLEGDDLVVKLTAIANLGKLTKTEQASAALAILKNLTDDPSAPVRTQVAQVVRAFDQPEAQAILLKLRQDEDHRVVGASLESLL